jgi:protein TonB
MKLRTPRWLASLPISVAIHLAIAAGAIALLRTDSALPPLIIDLNAVIAGRDDGPGKDGVERTAAPGRAGGRDDVARPPRVSEPVVPPQPTPARVAEAPAHTPPVPARVESAPQAPPTPDAQSTTPLAAETPIASVTGASPGAPSGAREGAGIGGPPKGDASGPAAGGGAGASRGGAGGERVASVAPGTGSGTGAGAGSEYAGYYARIRERIQESLRYPAIARKRGLAGTVQLEIGIAADGAFSMVSVIGSSSHEMLDRAAVDAARSVRRIPFPAGVPGRPLTVRLPVVFALE